MGYARGVSRFIVFVLWLGAVALTAQAPQVPAAVSPFPRGLSGTIAFQSDLRSAGNPDGRIRIYTMDLATGAKDEDFGPYILQSHVALLQSLPPSSR